MPVMTVLGPSQLTMCSEDGLGERGLSLVGATRGVA